MAPMGTQKRKSRVKLTESNLRPHARCELHRPLVKTVQSTPSKLYITHAFFHSSVRVFKHSFVINTVNLYHTFFPDSHFLVFGGHTCHKTTSKPVRSPSADSQRSPNSLKRTDTASWLSCRRTVTLWERPSTCPKPTHKVSTLHQYAAARLYK
jgi:hypothetical protein